jgi:PIN domain nuclease of toxin-antitoxin system
MNILLDTHVIIWALTNDPQLTNEAKALITDPENTVIISTVSLWEIAVKNQKAPHLCPYHEKEILDYCLKAGYLVMDIKAKHALEIRSLKTKPGTVLTNYDPFDRMLIAQAKSEKFLLLSHDRNYEYYGEDCIQAI